MPHVPPSHASSSSGSGGGGGGGGTSLSASSALVPSLRLSPQQLTALISGKVATVVQDSTVAVGATGGYIASGAVTTAGAIAQVDLNNT